MSVASYEELVLHVGHHIVCVNYSHPTTPAESWNAALECVDCGEVLLDFDNTWEERRRLPDTPDEQRSREAMGVYDPVTVYREMTDDEVAAEELTWD